MLVGAFCPAVAAPTCVCVFKCFVHVLVVAFCPAVAASAHVCVFKCFVRALVVAFCPAVAASACVCAARADHLCFKKAMCFQYVGVCFCPACGKAQADRFCSEIAMCFSRVGRVLFLLQWQLLQIRNNRQTTCALQQLYVLFTVL